MKYKKKAGEVLAWIVFHGISTIIALGILGTIVRLCIWVLKAFQ